jgi:hypothetical protein
MSNKDNLPKESTFDLVDISIAFINSNALDIFSTLVFTTAVTTAFAIKKIQVAAKLKHQSSIAVAGLKAELSAINTKASQYQAHILLLKSGVFEKQVTAIEKNYKLLVGIEEAVKDILRPDLVDENRETGAVAFENAIPKFKAYKKHFLINRIFFTNRTALMLQSYLNLMECSMDDARNMINNGESFQSEYVNRPSLNELYRKMNNENWQERAKIEDEFRSLLHIKNT